MNELPVPKSGLPDSFDLGESISRDIQNTDEFDMHHPVSAARKLFEDTQDLEYKATHDSLTGLLNHEGLLQKLDQRAQFGQPFGVIFIDLDRFKLVNDTLGHEAGDETLKKVGQFLQEILKRSSDDIAHETSRKGGDEFIILCDLQNGGNRAAIVDPQAAIMATEDFVRKGFREFVAGHSELAGVGLDASIGSDVWMPGDDIADILVTADKRMYSDKQGDAPS